MMVKLDDYLIAGNPDTPVEVMRKLCMAANSNICERLAANPNTPTDIMEKLAVNEDPFVRASLAENVALPRAIAEILCADPHPDVRFNLAENVKVAIELMQRLAEDDNPYVANAAHKTLDVLYFESMLSEQHFERQGGELARLGDLLVASAWLAEDLMITCVKQASSQCVPLGQVLLRTGLVIPEVLVNALKLQSSVRRGQISLSDAISRLADQKARFTAA